MNDPLRHIIIKMPLEEYVKRGWCCNLNCPYVHTEKAKEEDICKKCKTDNYNRLVKQNEEERKRWR